MDKNNHKTTFVVLFVCCYITAMAFFFFVRLFGVLWFCAELPNTDLPLILKYIIISSLWIFETFLVLKILTILSNKKSFIITLILCALTYIAFIFPNIIYIIDITIIFIIPLISNKDKESSIGYSFFYIIVILIYSLLMMIGRGYPILSKFSAEIQLFSIIDYKLFILGIYLLKREVLKLNMQKSTTDPVKVPGCLLIFGKEKLANAAKTIGSIPLYPIKKIMKAFNKSEEN